MGSIKRKGYLAAFALGVAILAPLAGDGSARAEGTDLTVTLSKLDITHGVGSEPADQVDMILNFNNTEATDGKCDATLDSPVKGFVVGLAEGACGGSPTATITVPAMRKIAANQYKYEGVTKEGATVDALLTKLITPRGSCGNWHLVLDATPLDLSSITGNPVATSITLGDGSLGCLSKSGTIDR